MIEQRAGFVGLGLMGFPMAVNLLRKGWEVAGWNRSAAALHAFEEQGGQSCASVEELSSMPVIIFMLPDLPFIEETVEPLLESWRVEPPAPGTVIVVMSSVSPAGVRTFGEAVHAASGGNAVVVDAPVSGGTKGAIDGSLAIMAGCDPDVFDRILPVLQAMGTTVRRMGPLGSGSLAKACNQLIVGTTTAALAEAAELAERSGMDVGALFEVLAGGLAGSRVLEQLGPRLAAKNYTPTGPAKFMRKDLGFVADAAEETATVVPMASAGMELYGHLVAQGLGDQDLAVVRQAIANLSGARHTDSMAN